MDLKTFRNALQIQRDQYAAELAGIDPAAMLAQAAELEQQWRDHPQRGIGVGGTATPAHVEEMGHEVSRLRSQAVNLKDRADLLREKIQSADRLLNAERVKAEAELAVSREAAAVRVAETVAHNAFHAVQRIMMQHDHEASNVAALLKQQAAELVKAAKTGKAGDELATPESPSTARRDTLAAAIEPAKEERKEADKAKAAADQKLKNAEDAHRRASLTVLELKHAAALADYAPILAEYMREHHLVKGYPLSPAPDVVGIAREIQASLPPT